MREYSILNAKWKGAEKRNVLCRLPLLSITCITIIITRITIIITRITIIITRITIIITCITNSNYNQVQSGKTYTYVSLNNDDARCLDGHIMGYSDN